MGPLRRLATFRKPGLAWLLWLAALLPLAQTAALAHAASHDFAAPASTDDDKALAHAAHCDLCLAAAALGSGAPAPSPVAPPLPPAAHEAPAGAPQGTLATRGAWSWQSRAPPTVSR